MDKTLKAFKIEKLRETYKDYKELLNGYPKENEEIDKAELYWIKTILKDLKWVLDDTQY